MSKPQIADGLPAVHKLPPDLHTALLAAPKSLAAWNAITTLARNEWICWNVTVKIADTRKEHIKRTITELAEGKRRPCCWLGCVHRPDKKLSPSQKFVLSRQAKPKK